MKLIVLLLALLIFSSVGFAKTNINIVGLSQLSNAIEVGTLETLKDKKFILKPEASVAQRLVLFPEEAYRITLVSKNVFSVVIVKPLLLVKNVSPVGQAPFFIPIYDKVRFDLIASGSGSGTPVGGGVSRCVIFVEFNRGTQVINFDHLSHLYTFKFKYNRSLLVKRRTEGSKVYFERVKSGYATVAVIMKNINTGKVDKFESTPIKSCENNTPRWSSWSGWSQCSESCGGGVRHRSRVCLSGSNCKGLSNERRSCNTQPCSQPRPYWSNWSGWSECSANCGGGTQERTRRCISSKDDSNMDFKSLGCVGSLSQARKCNERSCRRISMTEEQARKIRFDGLHVKAVKKRFTGLLRFNLKYNAILTNPFDRDIKCDLVLESHSGRDGHRKVIDIKVHHTVFAKAYSSTVEKGTIKCRRSLYGDGLNWATNQGHDVRAENCFFVELR